MEKKKKEMYPEKECFPLHACFGCQGARQKGESVVTHIQQREPWKLSRPARQSGDRGTGRAREEGVLRVAVRRLPFQLVAAQGELFQHVAAPQVRHLGEAAAQG